MNETEKLPEGISNELDELARKGNALAAKGEYREAFDAFNEMWDLLPQPKEKWNASTWILTSLGDVCYSGGKYEAARTNLEAAMCTPGGIGNPFVHLRLGQTYFELNELDRAADELVRAYALGGEELFGQGEKYLQFLRTRTVM